MNKIPFEILHASVEAMYNVKFEEHQLNEIDEHCLTIQAMIEGAGWTTEEYLQRWFYGETN